MSDLLHYPGDHLNFDPRHIVGPDMFQAFYRPVGATLNTATNQTAITFLPIPPDELQLRSLERFAEITAHARIEQLFGGGHP